jgi:hypothetical protein
LPGPAMEVYLPLGTSPPEREREFL